MSENDKKKKALTTTNMYGRVCQPVSQIFFSNITGRIVIYHLL